MFEDLEEDGATDVTTDSSDRVIAWVIWARADTSHLTPEEAWAVLHERYPDDARFLLLNAYMELSETRKQSEGRILAARVTDGALRAAAVKADVGMWSAGYFLKKVERVIATAPESLLPQIRDLVLFGSSILAAAKGDEAKTWTELRTKIGAGGEDAKRDDRDRAGIRLRRFEREVLKEIDERTQDNKPLGTRASVPIATAAPSGSDWATLVADTNKPRRRYAPDARFELGELVEHSKFGVGIVSGREPGKAVILFESGVRKLVAG
jgi:hypothetical protein